MTTEHQQLRMFLYVSDLLAQLLRYDISNSADSNGCKRTVAVIRKYLKSLTNSFAKTKTYPLKMLSTTREHHLCLCEQAVCIVALIYGAETYGKKRLRRSIVRKITSLITGYPEVVDVWLKILMSKKVSYVGNDCANNPDEYLYLTDKFKRNFFADHKRHSHHKNT